MRAATAAAARRPARPSVAEREELAAARVDQRERAGRAPAASAASVETPAHGRPRPSARPRAVAMPMRRPVNEPGPQPHDDRARCPPARDPARASTSSTSTSARCAAWPPSALANASSRAVAHEPADRARGRAVDARASDGLARHAAQTTDGATSICRVPSSRTAMRTTASGGGSTPAPTLAHSTKTARTSSKYGSRSPHAASSTRSLRERSRCATGPSPPS